MPGPLSFLTPLPDSWFWRADGLIAATAAALFLPAGIYFLLSALDDLAIDVCWALRSFLRRRKPPIQPARQKLIAVWLPLWNEAGVVRSMLEHNLAAIDYGCYEIFAGVYRNDAATRAEVEAVAARFPRVHLAALPHDGPTSKADCLNWVCRHMLDWERESGRRIEGVVIHDAEDLIHPQSLHAINLYTAEADMVQVPVLPLSTPWRELTHGLYCDDFAESQGKDLGTRVFLGAFLPGCGVGTAIRREAIDALAGGGGDSVFRPGCLTEDYDIGLRLFAQGARQSFVPLHWTRGSLMATREFFPRKLSAAIRQRTRWVTGNALQAWELHGWGAGLRRPLVQAWFFWRDRKGLWGNPVSLLCNILLLWGCLSWLASAGAGREWALARHVHPSPALTFILGLNLLLLLERLVVRMAVSARIYGWRFASGVPLRLFWGNWINARSAARALFTWTAAKLRRRPLGWLKTEHAYPSREALRPHKRSLAEVLVGHGWCTQDALSHAIAALPSGTPLGQFLLSRGDLSEDELYAALSLQESLPLAELDFALLQPRVARSLPAKVARQWNVLPFRIRAGALEVAGPSVPAENALRAISRFTRLDVRFFLLKPSHFEVLRRTIHPPPREWNPSVPPRTG